MAAAKPVRAAIIGLSANATTAWASTAHLPCFTCPSGKERFEIVALCNSSVAAAEAAIAAYGFDSRSTAAYGDPAALAADANVDLVICNTRVDRHDETSLPSIQAGKDVYIEWPIASNTSDIARLVQAAKKSGSKVLVGLQGRWARPVEKLTEILDSGVIGKVLSCDVRAFGGTNDREILPQGLAYFAQKEVGGNVMTIGVGHGESYTPHRLTMRQLTVYICGQSHRLCTDCSRRLHPWLSTPSIPAPAAQHPAPRSSNQRNRRRDQVQRPRLPLTTRQVTPSLSTLRSNAD